MATSRYYSKEDEDTGGGAAGGVLTGGGGGGVGAAPAAASGSGGSGFVNLNKYLEANRGGTGQIADTLAGDVGSRVAQSNQALQQSTQFGLGSARGMNTRGAGPVGGDFSQGAESQALAGLADYGMGADAQTAFLGHESTQEGIRDYGTGLADDQYARQEAIQRLYGAGRGSGFGALDSFLVAADDTSGLRGKLGAETGQLGDVGASRQQVQGAYGIANQARQANTTAQYQAARDADAARIAEEQRLTQAEEQRRITEGSTGGGFGDASAINTDPQQVTDTQQAQGIGSDLGVPTEDVSGPSGAPIIQATEMSSDYGLPTEGYDSPTAPAAGSDEYWNNLIKNWRG